MSSEIEELRKQVAELTARVWRLEQAQQPTGAPQPRSIPATPQETPDPPPHLAAKAQAKSLETRIGSQLFNRIGIIALDMNMWRFVRLTTEEKDPVWAVSQHGRHRSNLSPNQCSAMHTQIQ